MSNMEVLFQNLYDTLATKFSTTITASQKTSDERHNLQVPIILDDRFNYKVALAWFTVYNTIFNITSANNNFIYSVVGGGTWKNILLPNGAYEIDNINSEIQRLMKLNGDYDTITGGFYIDIIIQTFTSKAIINITNPSYQVDLAFGSNNIGSTLGFNPVVLSQGYNISPNIVNIIDITSINIETDLVYGAIRNNKQSNILYSIPAFSVPTGYKMIERPAHFIYLPLIRTNIFDYTIKITDQNGDIINFNGETISVYIEIKQV